MHATEFCAEIRQEDILSMTTRMLVVAGVALLSGCAAMQGPNMSAEQLAAMAKDSNANAVCTQITGAGGQGTIVILNVDKGSLSGGNGGSATIKPNCEVTMEIVPKPPKP